MLPKAYNEDDSLGIRRDVLVEARIEAEASIHQLRVQHITLDRLVDDQEGIWTDSDIVRIRQMQDDLAVLIDSCQNTLSDINDELHEIKFEGADER